ncbi:hypothetical protein [Calothrix sp. 336/3]|uniref:hypothetical protein n=1 Tax=Calothrix sp. 336/3 TaxID=1337936 RepID=UPI0004E397E0|nr:hypothetical protein [Calothrix sp. 336/3]AKG21239.1 hypothetical protein IJ00_07965 [Calothrix sp. 336/3]
MPLQEFLRIVVKLSNRVFTRHWLHFNYPETEPHLMAIAILGDHPVMERELQSLGLLLFKSEVRILKSEGREMLERITYFTVERNDVVIDD